MVLQALDSSGENVDVDGSIPANIDIDAVNISTQKYFPKKTEHTLLSGDFITYTPNVKHILTIEMQHLSKDNYEYIMTYISNRWKIESENGNYHPITGNKNYMYSGDTLDFNYSNQYKGAGFSGTLTFIETT